MKPLGKYGLSRFENDTFRWVLFRFCGIEKQTLVLPLIGRLKIEIAEMQLAEGAIPTLIGAARSSTVNPVPLVTRPASGGHSCGCWRDR